MYGSEIGLKKCPFCGEDVSIYRYVGSDSVCAECDCGLTTGDFNDIQELISFWNTRSEVK